MMQNYSYVKENYDALTAEIAELGRLAGREITLVAVTKSGTDEELLALLAAGAVHIGENRPGELARRGALLRDAGFSPVLHEIGNLQRNKVKLIAADVALIHSLDNVALAAEIEKQAAKLGRVIPVLIEINSGREENKDGIMPEDAEVFFEDVRKFPHLEIRGLMTMGPVCEDPEEARKYFRLTREIFDKLREKHPEAALDTLSMGMSDSYRVAIEEGSTLVRVGRRLFIKK